MLFSSSIQDAVDHLHSGHLLGLPTETVYGLAADASNDKALGDIFHLKGRPQTHPLILHISDQLEGWKRYTPMRHPLLDHLTQALWPGPVTFIVPKSDTVSGVVTGGKNTVGLRVPNHPLALQLLRESGLALAAPSANRFGKISPTTAQHVMDEFNDSPLIKSGEIKLSILDGGPCDVGVESTILDVSSLEVNNTIRVFRHGGLPLESLKLILTNYDVSLEVVDYYAKPSEKTEASGTFVSHYAPKTPCRLFHVGDLEEQLWDAFSTKKHVGVMAFSDRPEGFPESLFQWVVMPTSSTEYAQKVYAVLRHLDIQPIEEIWIETPPSHSEWLAIHDRLRRASFSQ